MRRDYAEDPANDFLPAPGRLLRHAPPDGFGVRVDAGVEQGGGVQIHYDPAALTPDDPALDRAAAEPVAAPARRHHVGENPCPGVISPAIRCLRG